MDMEWIPSAILLAKFYRVNSKSEKRAITEEEQVRILGAENNPERFAFYRMLWETGAGQSDCANLRAENFDLKECVLRYSRAKTGERCALSFGREMVLHMAELPKSGYLFPNCPGSPKVYHLGSPQSVPPHGLKKP